MSQPKTAAEKHNWCAPGPSELVPPAPWVAAQRPGVGVQPVRDPQPLRPICRPCPPTARQWSSPTPISPQANAQPNAPFPQPNNTDFEER